MRASRNSNNWLVSGEVERIMQRGLVAHLYAFLCKGFPEIFPLRCLTWDNLAKEMPKGFWLRPWAACVLWGELLRVGERPGRVSLLGELCLAGNLSWFNSLLCQYLCPPITNPVAFLGRWKLPGLAITTLAVVRPWVSQLLRRMLAGDLDEVWSSCGKRRTALVKIWYTVFSMSGA